MSPSGRFLLPSIPFLLAACGDQEVKLDDTGTDDTTTTATYEVKVVADDQEVPVDLFTLETVEFEGGQVVPVTAVLAATGLSVAWEERTYDFVAYDGYRPSTKDGCDPVDYTAIQGAYLYPGSGNLVWDASLGLFGCYFVDGMVEIDALAPAR